MKRLIFLALAASCGGSQTSPASAPTLPLSTPTAATEEEKPPASVPAAIPAKPAVAEPEAPPSKDPWEGRADLIQPPPVAKPFPVNLPKIQRFTLDNGLKVMVVESHELPIASFQLAIPAGSEDETREKRGVSEYTAAMLSKGTKGHTADQISETMDFIGGSLSASADLEATRVGCEAQSKDLATCLMLLPEVVAGPTFPEDEMKQVADQLITGIKQRRDNPTALAGVHFENALWGDDHARGWPQTIESVQAITRADLVAWHQQRFVADGAILAITGDVDAKALKAQLQKAFAGWKRGKRLPKRKLPEPKLAGVTVRLVDKPDLTQSQIVIGHLGVAHADPDFFATNVMNYSLGGGAFSSRLIQVVRSQGGKTYSASSSYEHWRTRGEFVAETFTRNAETLATLKLMLGEIERMHDGGPTEVEMAAAKANLEGRYGAHFQTARDVGYALIAAELHGLDEGFVRQYPLKIHAVSLEQAKAAARKHLDPKNLVIVIVGKGDEVQPQLEVAGYQVERVGYLDPISKQERLAKTQAKAAPVDPKKTAEGRKLLDAALAAKGGADRLRGLQDVVAKGKVKLAMGGQTLEGDWTRTLVVPDKLRVDVDIAQYKTTVTMSISDKAAWQKMGPQMRELPPDVAAQARSGLWRDRDLILLRHLEAGTVVQANGKETVDGKELDSVTIRKADGSNPTKILLDPQSHMIVRLAYEEDGSAGIEDYGDYRAVDGIQFPFHQKAGVGGQQFDVTIGEIKVNAGVPAGAFDVPKS